MKLWNFVFKGVLTLRAPFFLFTEAIVRVAKINGSIIWNWQRESRFLSICIHSKRYFAEDLPLCLSPQHIHNFRCSYRSFFSRFFRELNSNTIESLQNDGEKSRAKPSNQRHSVSVSWNVLNLGFICQAYLWTWSVWQKVRESERCRAKITNSRNILLSDNNASLVCIVRFAVDLSLLCRVLFFGWNVVWTKGRSHANKPKQVNRSKSFQTTIATPKWFCILHSFIAHNLQYLHTM